MTLPSGPATPTRAWVRVPGPAYAHCLRAQPGPDPDVERARLQHRGYVAALRDAGVAVEIIPPAPSLPDACFVEDLVVILDARTAVLTRPGAPARRSEAAGLVPRLRRDLVLWPMTAPATLDGGDVLRMGSRIYVGRSQRTNEAGVQQLQRLAAARGLEVYPIPVAKGLHLKSACTALDDRTVVVDGMALAPAVLERAGLTVRPVPEPAGANVLALGDRVLVSEAAPRTAAELRACGVTVVTVALDQFHRGDGALSCLSLRRPPEGGWSV